MQKLTKDLIELLFLRFSSIFGEKFSKNFVKLELYDMWCQEWLDGLAGIEIIHMKEAIDYCRLNLDWSPSIAEFRGICEKASGMPSCSEVMEAAIRRDFSHPITKIIYEKIGSWDMQNDKKDILTRKFSSFYKEAIAEYRSSLYRQYALETDKKITPIKEISHGKSHGSEVSRDNTGRDNMRKAEDYLSFGSALG